MTSATYEESLAIARLRGFVVARHNKRDEHLAMLWSNECLASHTPYIRVSPRRLWASVELDTFHMQRWITPRALEQIEAIFFGLGDRYHTWASSSSAPKCTVEEGGAVAAQVYAILCRIESWASAAGSDGDEAPW